MRRRRRHVCEAPVAHIISIDLTRCGEYFTYNYHSLPTLCAYAATTTTRCASTTSWSSTATRATTATSIAEAASVAEAT